MGYFALVLWAPLDVMRQAGDSINVRSDARIVLITAERQVIIGPTDMRSTESDRRWMRRKSEYNELRQPTFSSVGQECTLYLYPGHDSYLDLRQKELVRTLKDQPCHVDQAFCLASDASSDTER